MGGRTRTWRREQARQRRQTGTRTARLLQGATSWTGVGIAALLTIVVAFGVLVLTRHANSQAALEHGIDHKVSAQLAGIPQEGATLGRRTAPVTMEVFIDLEDPTSRWWCPPSSTLTYAQEPSGFATTPSSATPTGQRLL